jgi:copper chaperone CopZ
MKTFKLLMGLLLLSTVSFSQYRNIRLQAAGLTCSMCSNAINKSLKPLSFVAGIETDLKNNLFTITVKDGTIPDFDLLKTKVEGAGFSVGKMTVEVDFDNVSVKNDSHTSVGGKTLHFMNVKSQHLNGWQTVQLIDKSFVVASQYKKMQRFTEMECYKTGVAGNCCKMGDAKPGDRIYHVTI